jgi:hypothetical protein
MIRKVIGQIKVNPKDKSMQIVFSSDFGRYYNWFVCKNEWISLHPPLHGIHLTLTNKKLHNAKNINWDVARKWHNKSIEVAYNVDLREGGSAKKGFRNFYVSVTDPQIQEIKDDVGIIENSDYYGEHITIGSTKGNTKMYWPEMIELK